MYLLCRAEHISVKCKGKYDPVVCVGGDLSSWVEKRGEDSGKSIICFWKGSK